MHAPAKDTRAPDPKCCGCGLKPRCLANDLLRLTLIVLLLLPLLLMLVGCKERRGGATPSVAFGAVDRPAGSADVSPLWAWR
ncbi:hypothetical protein Tbd_1225 [Thiobacillus denitrificans ATCC 25259]|uniref:Transmembrane protein n=1 Tax=Thiobacillus denitrificans (strain ATCC 25259 / T1) TaxID=292415 RepID=Q3SEW8_THIDA|nr:hypothetical protein [Thiobacillus denitrificans]AAZ97178.1 hypothetical protein Tbd_1225 [Thiobacillus denitrificans ATCC 25259]